MAFQAQIVHPGRTIDYTPGADVAAGDVVLQGELFGVAPVAIKSGVKGSLDVAPVAKFAKAAGGSTAITAGALVYWDDTENVAKTDAESGANKLLGKVTKAAADADTVVEVLVTP